MDGIKKVVTRYALLLVFEYRRVGLAYDVPNALLAMEKDLQRGYELARSRFQIKRENITVVTDLRIKAGVRNPWDPLHADENKNPRIVRLVHPDIVRIVREIAQFVENTVRGIREVASKGGEVDNEVFIYISGHGALIPNPSPHEDNPEVMDNALIFTSSDGKSRKYFRDDDIFRILFGKMPVDAKGMMTVPIVSRVTKERADRTLYYRFSEEMIEFSITPQAYNRVRTVKQDEKMLVLPDRGLPLSTGMLVLIDTCHSGTMTDFHYIYDPMDRKMQPTRKAPPASFPICICIAASNDKEEAPSTTKGSLFTEHIYNILTKQKGTTTIAELHRLIYQQLPSLLGKCKPTITATIGDHEYLLPLLYPVDSLITRSASEMKESIPKSQSPCTPALVRDLSFSHHLEVEFVDPLDLSD